MKLTPSQIDAIALKQKQLMEDMGFITIFVNTEGKLPSGQEMVLETHVISNIHPESAVPLLVRAMEECRSRIT